MSTSVTPDRLKECMLETRGNRLFLVGVSVEVRPEVTEWTDGVRRAIAWDAVDDYLLFDSPDDFSPLRSAEPAELAMPMYEEPAEQEGIPVSRPGSWCSRRRRWRVDRWCWRIRRGGGGRRRWRHGG